MANKLLRESIEGCIQALLHWYQVDQRNRVKNKSSAERVAAAEADHLAKRRLRDAASFYLNQINQGAVKTSPKVAIFSSKNTSSTVTRDFNLCDHELSVCSAADMESEG